MKGCATPVCQYFSLTCVAEPADPEHDFGDLQGVLGDLDQAYGDFDYQDIFGNLLSVCDDLDIQNGRRGESDEEDDDMKNGFWKT